MTAYELGLMLREITANANVFVGSKASAFGINYGQFEYFLLIYSHPGINQLELARRKGVGKASVTKALRILEEEGLILRQADPTDQRNLLCSVSTRGDSIARTLIGISDAVSAELFQDFSAGDMKLLGTFLGRLLANTRRMAESVQEPA